MQAVHNRGLSNGKAPWELGVPLSLPAHLNHQLSSHVADYNNFTHQLQNRTLWNRIQSGHGMTASASSPDLGNSSLKENVQTSLGMTSTQHNQKLLVSPLPQMNWADHNELWKNMMRKDVLYSRNPTLLCRHPTLQPKMRSVLLSWMTEVCEVYKLHRETYYLAIDLLDRFLSVSQQEVAKNNLQLVGITALFVAAKIEEIYPPKVRDFAYVTDGACLVQEIKRMEVIMLNTLEWQLCPMTAIGWLSTFLQVAYLSDRTGRECNSCDIVVPKFSRDFFVCMAQILDLCILDIESLRFPYSHLAASALYHLTNRHITQAGSGISIETLLPCIEWMRPFVEVLIERGFSETHIFDGISTDEQHTIQNHSVDFELLDIVHKKAAERQRQQLNARSEQRELFAAAQQRFAWSTIAESPMRQTVQLLPLTPSCTPPDNIGGKMSEAIFTNAKMGNQQMPSMLPNMNHDINRMQIAPTMQNSAFFPTFSYANE